MTNWGRTMIIFIKIQQFKDSTDQCTLGHWAEPQKSVWVQRGEMGRYWQAVYDISKSLHSTWLLDIIELVWVFPVVSSTFLTSVSYTLSPAFMSKSLMPHAFKNLTRNPIYISLSSRIVQTSCLSCNAAMVIRLLHSENYTTMQNTENNHF